MYHVAGIIKAVLDLTQFIVDQSVSGEVCVCVHRVTRRCTTPCRTATLTLFRCCLTRASLTWTSLTEPATQQSCSRHSQTSRPTLNVTSFSDCFGPATLICRHCRYTHPRTYTAFYVVPYLCQTPHLHLATSEM